MTQKSLLVRTGDFFFKYRNVIFPIVLVGLFLAFKTRDAYFNSEGLEVAKDAGAIVLTVAGLVLRGAVIGFRYIKRGGLNKKVYAENLVTDGFFGVCRNPLYVANLMIYAGVLLMHGEPLVLLIGLAFFLGVYHAIVAAEEYFLSQEFGAAYAAYCTDVPRWRLRLSKLRAATDGMHFNLKRALLKDYGTIANAVVSLALLEMLEQIQFYPHVQWTLFVVIISLTIIVGLAVRVGKKRGMLTVS